MATITEQVNGKEYIIHSNLADKLTTPDAVTGALKPNTEFISSLGISTANKFEDLTDENQSFTRQITLTNPALLYFKNDPQKAQERENSLTAYANYVYANSNLTPKELETAKTELKNKIRNMVKYYNEYNIANDIAPQAAVEALVSFSNTPEARDILNEPNVFDGSVRTPGITENSCFYETKPVCTVNGEGAEKSGGPAFEAEGTGQASNEPVAIASSSVTPKSSYINNAWIVAWEPMQKIGIVKVPLSKILQAITPPRVTTRSDAVRSAIGGDENTLYSDALAFDLEGLKDFNAVKRRVFLPLSSSNLVVLKEFSVARKNIQQVEITHGSKYFQVFTESFPEFNLQIEAIKFADIAKKVKLFFDNVMKRVSETNRYSGGLYLYDVIAERIPSYSALELSNLVAKGDLVRYRLLPRSIRMGVSSEDPNKVKITIDGIIVEWEKQKPFNIATTKSNANAGKSSAKPVEPPPNTYISPSNPKYKESFATLNITTTGTDGKAVAPYNVPAIGNTLYKREDTAKYFESFDAGTETGLNLWELANFKKDAVITELSSDFDKAALEDINKSILSVYQNFLVYLSEEYRKDDGKIETPKDYNDALWGLQQRLGIPSEKQRANFRKGFNAYAVATAVNKQSATLFRLLLDIGITKP